ncbi:OmpA family protein [Kerstersia sp.]|uniref:OmpA family protein n=1 Tax=Kerstersia sp. TaxID=1930783 RepID=UPI003F930F89
MRHASLRFLAPVAAPLARRAAQAALGLSITMAALPLASHAAPGNPAAAAIDQIPVSRHTLGSFPFLQAPAGYSYNYIEGIPSQAISDFGREYFAVDGKLYRQEGKTFKINLEKSRSSPGRFNQALVESSYEQAITALGGVQVHTGKVSSEERERIGKAELLEKQYGYSLLVPDHVQTYVIRRPGSDVWIQLSTLDEESGVITILETAAIKPLEVSAVDAAQLGQSLAQQGRATLDILFDTDQASLTPEGALLALEIGKLLRDQPALTLTIEGHTDDTGGAAHNQALSQRRAETVAALLGTLGIAPARLHAVGRGATQPRAANDSPANRALNRRVVLVKNAARQ